MKSAKSPTSAEVVQNLTKAKAACEGSLLVGESLDMSKKIGVLHPTQAGIIWFGTKVCHDKI